jgi:hypothetical protein
MLAQTTRILSQPIRQTGSSSSFKTMNLACPTKTTVPVFFGCPPAAARSILVNGRLTATDNRLPVWAPDGSKILFQRRVDLTSDVYNLYT